MEELEEKVAHVMRQNQRTVTGRFYTTPSPVRYPFQWFWDSCFHAFIYNSLGQSNLAQQELQSACAQIQDNGFIPHINFWYDTATPRPNWGRELRGEDLNHIFNLSGSSLTQPPLIARAVLETYHKTKDLDFLQSMYPKVTNYFAYLRQNRQYEETELLYIINPDESGEDNSPRFDEALDLPPLHTASESLDKRIDLMKELVSCDFDTKTCMKKYFAIVDVGFNCIYQNGLQALTEMATLLDESAADEYSRLSILHAKSMRQFLTTDGIIYNSLDTITGEMITVRTWNIFMPLFAGVLEKNEAETLVANFLEDENFMTEYGICTTSRTEPCYEPVDGFWRGPIWFAPHWFIHLGLKKYGYDTVATSIKLKSLELITKSGFREHYDGETGVGYGADTFTWPGLVITMKD